eukprot:GFUD01016893.1.p1 GENE.GFUD01016893.1~~GFUD01016893.1.p1  ORF type:complete len:236 (-),score=68.18 GFUD01016893.1:223-930(-)
MSQELSKTLVRACETGDLVQAQICLDQGADVNFSRQPFGWTPLTSALFNKHQQVVLLLLENPDTDVDKANSGGMTPLHMACDLENMPAIHFILKRSRESLNSQTSSGCTPLMVAASYGKVAAVKAMLEVVGIDLNTKNIRKKSLEDVSKGHPEILSLLRNARRNIQSGHLHHQTAPSQTTVCPSCMTPLCSKMTVFQCSMGHLTCKKCRETVKRCTECGTEFSWRGVSLEQVTRG